MATIRHALVLAAGLGTRLRPLTFVRAKAAMPIAGEPLIWRFSRWLVGWGVSDLVVNLHHLPETITAVLGDGSDLGGSIRYSWEQPHVLGTAGGPRRALSILGADTFFIANGDMLTDVNRDALAAAHAAWGALVTLAVIVNPDPMWYGGVAVDGDSRVTGFVPRGPRATGSFHFVGVQVASAEAFADLPDNQEANSIGGVYDRLIASEPGSVRAFVSDASFRDIGTVGDYVETSRAIAWQDASAGRRSGATLEPSAADNAIVWDNVEIGAGARLENCIVTDGVRVPSRACYRHVVLLRGAHEEVVAIPWTNERG